MLAVPAVTVTFNAAAVTCLPANFSYGTWNTVRQYFAPDASFGFPTCNPQLLTAHVAPSDLKPVPPSGAYDTVGSTVTGNTRAGSESHPGSTDTVTNQPVPSAAKDSFAEVVAGSRTPSTPEESHASDAGIVSCVTPVESLNTSEPAESRDGVSPDRSTRNDHDDRDASDTTIDSFTPPGSTSYDSVVPANTPA